MPAAATLSRPARTPHLRLVPAWLSLTLVVSALGAAAWLIPSREQLAGRFIEDGDHEKAMEIITEVSAPEAEDPGQPLSPLDRLRATLTSSGGALPAAAAVTAIREASDPAACLAMVRDLGQRLPESGRRDLYLTIGRSALAQNDPAMAATIYQEMLDSGLADDEVRDHAIQAWRWSGHSDKALAVLKAWRGAGGGTLPPAAEDEEITVSREVNDNGRALDLLLPRLKQAVADGTVTPAQLDTALDVAGCAERTPEVLPLLTAWLATKPAATAPWEELASGRVKADADFSHYAGILARQAEWNGRPGEAMDWYLKLGLCGDTFSIERVAELHRGLSREGDWRDLLAKVVPVAGHPEYSRELPHLLADAGLYAAAEKAYLAWLEEHPRDVSALTELAAAYSEVPRLDDALRTLRKAQALAPDNLEIGKEIADIQIAVKDFASAFHFFQQLPEESHDALTLENYALLAESLGDYRAYNRALLIRYHRLHKPSASDFLELARSFTLLGDTNGVFSTLHEGMDRLPQSRILRIQLAEACRNTQRFDDAIQLLAQPELKDDMQAMALFIEVCSMKEDYQYAYSFLGRGMEKRFAFPPDVRLDLGHIYYNNGFMADADKLYSSVPDSPAMWPLLATARLRRGDFASAEIYQKKHLESTVVTDPQDWMTLGDIYRGQGREAEAQDAYNRSLTLMEGKVAPETAQAGSTRPVLTPAPAAIPQLR